jgi:methionyl-tRNA formyltransferase
MTATVVFMGTPQFAVPILQALLRGPYQVNAVYSQEPKPSGRGRKPHLSPVAEVAHREGLRVVYPGTFASAEARADLASFQPDVVVVAAFGRILPKEILSVPKCGCLNLHPSLLPRHRGPSPVAGAILAGDRVTGVTIMLMDEGMDTGPIVAQEETEIGPGENAGQLTMRLSKLGAELLAWAMPRWLDGKLKTTPQDETKASYSTVIWSTDGELDWRLSAEELWRRVRAFTPWPGCYTLWKGKRLKITAALPLEGCAAEEVGKVVGLPRSSPAEAGVLTGSGILGLCRVQLEGKREMAVAEFLRGQQGLVGARLG